MTDASDINSLLYNYLLLFLLFVEKTLSPIEKLLNIEIKYQRKIYTVISEYIDVQSSPSCRPIIVLFTLYNRVLELEKKVNELSNKEETFIQTISQLENELKEKTKELDEAIQKEMDTKKRNNEDIISDFDLTYMKMKKSLNDQDYCKIILKKDYTISQLKKLLNNKEQRDNSNLTMSSILNEKQILFNDIITKYESQIKKLQNELDNLKSNTKIEFELMTSAMYNLGLNYLNYRNDTVNQREGIPSWVIKEKKFLMENYFQNYLKE